VGDKRIMDEPDLVSSEYAVHSAVFFWDKNNLNRFTDKDDVVGLTRRINGGDNGGARRDGKIVEGWNCFDFLSMYQQIGWVNTPPTP
jgi:predicted chitinase